MICLGIYILFLGYRSSSHLKVNEMQWWNHKTSDLRDLKLYIDRSYNISSLYSLRNSHIIWIKVSGFSHQFFFFGSSVSTQNPRGDLLEGCNRLYLPIPGGTYPDHTLKSCGHIQECSLGCSARGAVEREWIARGNDPGSPCARFYLLGGAGANRAAVGTCVVLNSLHQPPAGTKSIGLQHACLPTACSWEYGFQVMRQMSV